jgi:hypothetical protein
MQHTHAGVSELDLLLVSERPERDFHLRDRVETIFRACAFCQRRATRPVIGVDVCIDHVGNAHVLRGSKCGVRIEIIRARIDHCACT